MRVIVDGNFQLHRILKTPALADYTVNGRKLGGVYGVLKLLRSILRFKVSDSETSVSSVYWVWDGGHSPRRKEIYPQYKEKSKDETEDDKKYKELWRSQQRELDRIFPVFGVHSIQLSGREGDDVIALVCALSYPAPVVIISDDSDMFQLVNSRVKIYQPKADRLITESSFESHVGYKPEQALLYKVLVGDTNEAEGIPGVGEKTAYEILKVVPTISGLRQGVELLGESNRRARKVLEHWHKVGVNMELLDLGLEEFSIREVLDVRRQMKDPLPFDHDTALKCIRKYGLQDVYKDTPDWFAPFYVLG